MNLGCDIKAVWIASVPRTGSMWTFNVTRELVRAADLALVPDMVPRSDEEMIGIGSANIETGPEGQVAVLKVHVRLNAAIPKSVFIVPKRDVRDSLVSFMRFANADFERGLEFVRGARLIERHYDGFSAERRLTLAYEEITGNPVGVVRDIAGFLGIEAKADAVHRITERFQKAAVARKIAQKNADMAGADQTVASLDGGRRAFDPATGFQSGHVSDYRDGDWRHILSVSQQQKLADLLG